MSSAFDKLARPVQKWIRHQAWHELRDIQVRSIQAIYDSNDDVIVAASTAGGKTESAFLPLISQVLDDPIKGSGFDLLYIGPLKALITDQAMRLEGICREAELPVTPWHGDVSQSIKARALKRPKGILLITPESLEALFIRRGLEIQRLFGRTRAIVIDELHTVLDSERGVQLRSLLTRLELAIERPIRRVGLSATLGDMELAKGYLRSDNIGAVRLIEAEGGDSELRLQLRGYLSGEDNKKGVASTSAIADHLFKHLRGSDNLVFAGARQCVEIYADRLRELCERSHLPQEFYAHHASLSRDHREFVECRLKDPAKPTTAICTSTLELGIDIGDVMCVAQIGAPYSVAALRQRIGRSGRRKGQPAILRQYAVEAKLNSESSLIDRLRLGLIRSIAMIDLLLEAWCEPPKPQAIHLSTLIHQVLSVIAQHGGITAARLFRILCREGPFRQITSAIFTDVLRAIGSLEEGLIEQSDSGLLLLGPAGERLVEHYSFYAVFQTPDEFRLVSDGRDLGTLPVDNVLSPGMLLIFSGRRWKVQEIYDQDKVIVVNPAESGVAPLFNGSPGEIHDLVIERMFMVLEGDQHPSYLDVNSRDMLDEARFNYANMGLKNSSIIQSGEHESVVVTRVGTVKTTTLALALKSMGFMVEQHDGFLIVNADNKAPTLQNALERLAMGEHVDLFSDAGNLVTEKYHSFLSRDLLVLDVCSSKLDPGHLESMAGRLLSQESLEETLG